VISGWLRTLSADDRTYFVMRYWNGVPLKDIAKRFGITPDRLAQKMHRLRAGLKEALEKEDISL
jgi:RNA polymerase sigma factor (sigma-70 family)